LAGLAHRCQCSQVHSDSIRCTKWVHRCWVSNFVLCLASCLSPVFYICPLHVLCSSCIYLVLSKRILLLWHIRLSPNWSASLTPLLKLRTRTVRQITLISNLVSDSGAYAVGVEYRAGLTMLRKPSSCLCLSVSGGLKFSVSPHNFLFK